LVGLAGCAADEEPAPSEGALDNDLYLTEPSCPWALNIG